MKNSQDPFFFQVLEAHRIINQTLNWRWNPQMMSFSAVDSRGNCAHVGRLIRRIS